MGYCLLLARREEGKREQGPEAQPVNLEPAVKVRLPSANVEADRAKSLPRGLKAHCKNSPLDWRNRSHCSLSQMLKTGQGDSRTTE
jgi:hypothetical protein